jgi:hypothetical protein
VGADSEITGIYQDLRVVVEEDRSITVGVATGQLDYREIAKFGTGEDQAQVGASTIITGTYA